MGLLKNVAIFGIAKRALQTMRSRKKQPTTSRRRRTVR
jgi:hypothetical protein